MDKGDNFMTLSETWQTWSWVGVREERSPRIEVHAPKWPQSAWWMQGVHCWRDRELIWKSYLSYFLLLEIQVEFREISWISGKKQGMPHSTLEASSFEDPKKLLINLVFQRRHFGWCFKQMKKGTFFCKVNCFCGTQRKWDVILALLGILKINY